MIIFDIPYLYLMVSVFLKEWIMDQWDRNYYISALAGASNGSSLVVMSKGNSKLAV
jgi:hypothetical protein